MALIHHPLLQRELEVSAAVAEVMTTNPRKPWKHGPLPKRKPTAATHVPEEGTPEPPSEED